MKHLKKFNETVSEDILSRAEKLKLTTSEENAKILVDFQKENGGVISFNDNDPNAKEIFKNLGYEIKSLTVDEFMKDEQIKDDIENFNNVNYVIAVKQYDEPVLLGTSGVQYDENGNATTFDINTQMRD
jgi:hypothetical protein